MKQLSDWRIPAIFEVPVLLWAGLLYLILQSHTVAPAMASIDKIAVTWATTPIPSFVPTPYPTVAPIIAPVYPAAIPCSNAAAITAFHATTTVEHGNVVIRVTDQNGRLVSCAWAIPKGGNHALGGETDTTGTVVYPLADLPTNDYFFGVIQMKGTSATTAYSFSR